MTTLPPSLDYKAMRSWSVALGRQAYARFLTETEILADWVGWLRSLDVECPREEMLAFALRSDELSPGRWSESKSKALAPEIALALDGDSPGYGFNLTPQAAYVLGRSAMREAMRHPIGSSGLTACFKWLRAVDGGYVTLAGVDDEFLEASPSEAVDRAVGSACQLIASDPASVLNTITEHHSANAIALGAAPVSLEACVDWRIGRPAFGLDIGRIILLAARARPQLAIEFLQSLGNAALIAAALQDQDYATDDVLINLVAAASPLFECDMWTGAFSARLLLDAFEKTWTQQLRQQFQASGSPPDCDLMRQELRLPLGRMLDAIGRRPDGTRLLLEWTAHALMAFWGNLSARWRGGARSDQFQPERALAEELLQAVRICFEGKPETIWSVLGGPSVSRTDLRAEELPVWTDAVGRRDAVTPFLLASLACQGASDCRAADISRRSWLVAVVADLENQPRLGDLTERGSGAMARAFSLAMADDADLTGLLGDLWSAAGWLRTRARFASDEEIYRLTQAVGVVPQLGIRSLDWLAERGSAAPVGALELLADIVDEMRYSIPQPGSLEWADLVCDLASVNCKFGGARHALRLTNLLRRYHGDDDALAAAAVGAAQGGLSDEQVRQALADADVETTQLGKRWFAWNADISVHSQDTRAPFANVLARLVRFEV